MERAEAEKAVDAIFEDLRDRRFLKWLFADQTYRREPGMIARFAGGDELHELSADVQAEIREAWISILMKQH